MSVPFASEHRDENCHAACCGGPYEDCSCNQCATDPDFGWTDEQRERYNRAMRSYHEAHSHRIPRAGES